MGIIETNYHKQLLQIVSNIFIYGNAISEEVRRDMEEEINWMWNEPRALLWLEKKPFLVEFAVKVFLYPNLQVQDVISNTNPRNNYFRIEEYAHGNISFVDGLGCNTGYFKLEDMDIRGKGIPGIMFPRGTLVNAEYQYDPNVASGQKGGTLYPIHRRVKQGDIDDLGLLKIVQSKDKIIGKFSSVYHEAQG
jgi:hypothetical protein